MIEVKPDYKLVDNHEQTKLTVMKFHARRRRMDFSIWAEKELGLLN